MLKYRHTFGQDSEFKAWMYQIARTARIDRFRGERKLTAYSENIRERPPGPDRLLESEEQAEWLQRALLRLPEDKREILILARYQEMKYDQIAALLNTGVGTVKVRVHRAIGELREIFLQMSGERPKCDVKKSGKRLPTI
jgi:RNA polymerase sigma-70 factor (ECF subfamily)